MENQQELRRFILNVDFARAIAQLGIDAKWDAVRKCWVAQCPNALLGHRGEDKHPSWTLQDDIHHDMYGVHSCWSCGYSGNIISLVRDVLNTTWDGSKAWLQTHAMRGESFAPLNVEIQIVEPLSFKPLHAPEGVNGLGAESPIAYVRYWTMKRHFSLWDAQRWGIGYATMGQCAGRIWIPIYNATHHLVNWTARTISDNYEPRYLRASSTDNPDKGVMFGEEFWPNNERDTLAVFEGELNALRIDSLFRVPVAAWGGGSKLNPIHAMKMLTFKRLIVFADGDQTGDTMTEQLRFLALPMAVVRFSKGYDPCSTPVADLLEYGQKLYLIPKT
jgi:hypothetical protein